eukprot:SAG11_NODE_2277_length_3581_cov_3.122918_3_plen_35_part_00
MVKATQGGDIPFTVRGFGATPLPIQQRRDAEGLS